MLTFVLPKERNLFTPFITVSHLKGSHHFETMRYKECSNVYNKQTVPDTTHTHTQHDCKALWFTMRHEANRVNRPINNYSEIWDGALDWNPSVCHPSFSHIILVYSTISKLISCLCVCCTALFESSGIFAVSITFIHQLRIIMLHYYYCLKTDLNDTAHCFISHLMFLNYITITQTAV